MNDELGDPREPETSFQRLGLRKRSALMRKRTFVRSLKLPLCVRPNHLWVKHRPLVEVLSDSTERKDKGEKQENYLAIDSLQTYLNFVSN